ncbi:hypothetical protein [Microbacterium sp. P02]|uniref:hypothetical protein n=1 Tax=Microbacterium sp. P02 TaxID=3366260 RepID=UPI00366E3F88
MTTDERDLDLDLDADDLDEDDLDSTVLVDRTGGARGDDGSESTIVVDRAERAHRVSDPGDDDDLDTPGPDDLDSPGPDSHDDTGPDSDDDPGSTIVVDRAGSRAPHPAPTEEATILGPRRTRRANAESAVEAPQPEPAGASEAESGHARSDAPAAEASAALLLADGVQPFEAPHRPIAPHRPRSHRAKRTRIILPPSTEASTRAVVGVGPGAVEPYAPRDVPPPPVAAMELAEGPEASRADAPQMPSVRRASARGSAIALASVAGACVVSVAGLAWIAVSVFGG